MCPQGNESCYNETCTCDPCLCGIKDDDAPGPDHVYEQCTE